MRQILKMGDPRLMEPSAPVTENEFGTKALQDIITELWQYQEYYDGVGIAAPQIGIFKQIVVLGFEVNNRYKNKKAIPRTCLINPVITPLGEEINEDWEGCLSVPGLRGLVPRYQHIHYAYYDHGGVRHEAQAEDFHARVIQHECDHLQGILFPARIENFKKFGYEDTLPEFST